MKFAENTQEVLVNRAVEPMLYFNMRETVPKFLEGMESDGRRSAAIDLATFGLFGPAYPTTQVMFDFHSKCYLNINA